MTRHESPPLTTKKLLEQHVDLGGAPGRANVAAKAMTVVASVLAGGDCIDDADALRATGSEVVLGHRVAAPSTLGTFLRSFTWATGTAWPAIQRPIGRDSRPLDAAVRTQRGVAPSVTRTVGTIPGLFDCPSVDPG